MKIRIKYPFDTTWTDYPDPYSQAVLLYFPGCDIGCEGCSNLQLQDPFYKIGIKELSLKESFVYITYACRRNNTDKIIFSGGNCLHKTNINGVKKLIETLADYDICIYSGYDVEEVLGLKLYGFKYLKCGGFDINQRQESIKTDDYIQFASKNQVLYNQFYQKISTDGRYYF